MIPIFVIVVVSPAKKGNAPQTPHPIAPKKNSCLNSFLIVWKFFINKGAVKGNRINTTDTHLQNAKEIGGTYSTPPLATTRLLAIKIGWINKSEYAKKFWFFSVNLTKINFYQKKLRRPS